MNLFENAKLFFEACETAKGWNECKQYVEADAQFSGQSDVLKDMKTVKEYSEWMKVNGTGVFPGATYTLHASAFDEESSTALFYGTYHAHHTGSAGPVPPTNKKTNSEYVYAVKMSNAGKVIKMVKVWNSTWALGELGWIN